jgi:DNA polymerase III alpha subunit (gram-positive type)
LARATWFCIDIECSGPVPGLYDMLSLGAVVVAHGPDGPQALPETFYVEIRPTAPRVDAGAMKVNRLDLERLKVEGLSMRAALERLSAFVVQHRQASSEAVFVGHNAPFDWSFVSHAYHSEGLRNPFGYKALDTKALAMGVLGVHWLDTSKEMLERLLALPPLDAAQVHRADYDARYQADILVALLRRMPDAGDHPRPTR